LAYLIVSSFLDTGRSFVLQCPVPLQFQNADKLFIAHVGQLFRNVKEVTSQAQRTVPCTTKS